MRTLTPFLSLIIAVLLYIFFTQPHYAGLTAVKEEASEYETAVKTYHEFNQLLEQKLNMIKGRSTLESERLDRLVPTKLDNARLIVDLEHMATSQGLLFGNIKSVGSAGEIKLAEKAALTNAELSTLDISFNVIGSYEQFKAFLNDLDNSLTIFEITKLQFDAIDDAQNKSLQQFSVTVRTYALPESQ
jgi:Tfp pilus assembly protein PilO